MKYEKHLILEMLYQRKTLIISFLTLFIGLLLGSFAYNLSSFSIANDINEWFASFNTDITNKTAFDMFFSNILGAVIYLGFMIIVGGSIYGKVFIIIINTFKSAGIGSLVAFLYSQYSIEGFEYTLLVLLPGKVILLFSMLFIGETCLKMSANLRTGINKTDFQVNTKDYTIKSALSFGIIFFSCVIDFLCFIAFSGLFAF